MIEKVYEIARFLSGGEPAHEKLAEISNREHGYFVVVDLDSGIYRGLKRFEPRGVGKKILFAPTPGNQTVAQSPSINLQGDEKRPEKDDEVVKKVLSRFLNFFNRDTTRDIYRVLEQSKDLIFDDLKNISPKDRKNSVLSILVIENGKEFMPAEHDGISRAFEEVQFSKRKGAYDKCFLCGREVPSYPQLNEVFKFATFDKPGFTPVISKKSEGVLSICDECRIVLKTGRNIVEEKLSFRFFGDTLWIIPSVPDKGSLTRLMESIENLEVEDTRKKQKEKVRRFESIERRIEKRLSEHESVHYDFLVLRMSNSEEKIMMHATEISPSRLSQIYIKAQEIEKETFHDPNLSSFYALYKPPKSKESGRKQFYELVRSIYEGTIYSKDVFLSYAMRWAKHKIIYSESGKFLKTIEDVGRMLFSNYLYLVRLGVLKGGVRMEGEKFFERFSEFFDEEWKKAVFLTGVLTGYLLNYQMKERQSAPFFKKLKGLKMRKEDVEGLLAELKSKFLQYKIENENLDKIFKWASESFLRAGNWSASVDEINFVITVGMSMYKVFLRGDEDEKE